MGETVPSAKPAPTRPRGAPRSLQDSPVWARSAATVAPRWLQEACGAKAPRRRPTSLIKNRLGI
eukprot:3787396-Pyramimonas_sp.AAC.1